MDCCSSTSVKKLSPEKANNKELFIERREVNGANIDYGIKINNEVRFVKKDIFLDG